MLTFGRDKALRVIGSGNNSTQPPLECDILMLMSNAKMINVDLKPQTIEYSWS